MDDHQIREAFLSLHSHFTNLAELEQKPLLAHYTSLDCLEKIANTRELWFSNPLFMNDLQEVRFGLTQGYNIFYEQTKQPAFIEAIGPERALQLHNSFYAYYMQYEDIHAINLYVFCLSVHEPTDRDGRLSMWRGYGGNGGGAALVFNTDFVTRRDDSPILFGKVSYTSDGDRRGWIRHLVTYAQELILENDITAEQMYNVSFRVFEMLKLHALLTKHPGFREEEEWRIIYMPELDTSILLTEGFSYIVGKSGIEPKLRFPIKPLPFEDPSSWHFESIVDRVLLGPTLSTRLAVNAVKNMFKQIGLGGLSKKVVASSIPFRSQENAI